MGKGRTHVVLSLGILLTCCACSFVSDPSVDVTQYARTAWTSPYGFFLDNIYALARRRDRNLWFGGKSGLFRVNGVDLAPADQTIAWGRRIIDFRAEVTARAIRKAVGGE